MKKVLAAVLSGLLCVTAFTGCSATELSYLKMSKEIMDTMKTCKVSGQIQMDMDFDGLAAFSSELSGMEISAEELGVTGKKSAKLDYVSHMDMTNMAFDMDMDLVYDGKKYELGDLYYGLTDGVYISGETILGVYQLAMDVAKPNEDSYLLQEGFAKDLKTVLNQHQYIQIVDMEEMGVSQEELEAVLPTDYQGIYDAAFRFYEDVFKGFQTDMVKEVSGGYQIQTDGKAAAQMLVSMLDFIAQNPDQVFDATEVYLTEVVKQMNDEEALEEIQELMVMIKEEKQSFISTVYHLKATLESALQDDAVSKTLDSLHYVTTMKKNGDKFVSDSVFDVTYKGQKVLKITAKSTTEKMSVNMSAPKNSVSMDTLIENVSALIHKYNPVTGVEMSWGWGDDNTEAMLLAERAEEVPFGFMEDHAWVNMQIKDGRAYLPLRLICNTLGEPVTWNNAEKTAYVIVDGKNVPMKGLIQDGRTFVAVRDFEKLGYTVSYVNEDGIKTATIAR